MIVRAPKFQTRNQALNIMKYTPDCISEHLKSANILGRGGGGGITIAFSTIRALLTCTCTITCILRMLLPIGGKGEAPSYNVVPPNEKSYMKHW